MKKLIQSINTFTKLAKEHLVGGIGDGSKDEDFDKKQMEMGEKVEMEHTNNPEISREISRDHLSEIPTYYTRLEKMEEEAKEDDDFIDVEKPSKS